MDEPSLLPPIPDLARRADRRDTQQLRLFRALAELLTEEGWSAVTVSKLAARAGVSTRAFYEHFADKEACLLVAYETMTATAIAHMRTHSAGPAGRADSADAAGPGAGPAGRADSADPASSAAPPGPVAPAGSAHPAGSDPADSAHPAGWRGRLARMLESWFDLLAREPHFTRIYAIEIWSVSPASQRSARAGTRALVDGLRGANRAAHEEDASVELLDDDELQMLAGGIHRLVVLATIDGTIERLSELAPAAIRVATATVSRRSGEAQGH